RRGRAPRPARANRAARGRRRRHRLPRLRRCCVRDRGGLGRGRRTDGGVTPRTEPRLSTMTIAELTAQDEQESTPVLEWRFSQLRRSGYAVGDALVLATPTDVDLHRADDLGPRGCPPPLALPILPQDAGPA